MLRPAQLYQSEINSNHILHWYDPKYKFARCDPWSNALEFPDDNMNQHCFASVSNKDRVLGFIGYNIDWVAQTVSDVFAESYDIGNQIFLHDLFTAITDIFEKYHLDRLEWSCIVGNPVLKHYRKFCKSWHGREVGTFKNRVVLSDGNVYDQVYFEVFAKGYYKWKYLRRNKND